MTLKTAFKAREPQHKFYMPNLFNDLHSTVLRGGVSEVLCVGITKEESPHTGQECEFAKLHVLSGPHADEVVYIPKVFWDAQQVTGVWYQPGIN